MFQYKPTVTADSSAARSVARRRGIGGRLRHLQTRHLWLQSRVSLDHLKLDVVAGERNPADILTKLLPGRKIREWSEHMLVKDGCSNHDNKNDKLWKTS